MPAGGDGSLALQKTGNVSAWGVGGEHKAANTFLETKMSSLMASEEEEPVNLKEKFASSGGRGFEARGYSLESSSWSGRASRR